MPSDSDTDDDIPFPWAYVGEVQVYPYPSPIKRGVRDWIVDKFQEFRVKNNWAGPKDFATMELNNDEKRYLWRKMTVEELRPFFEVWPSFNPPVSKTPPKKDKAPPKKRKKRKDKTIGPIDLFVKRTKKEPPVPAKPAPKPKSRIKLLEEKYATHHREAVEKKARSLSPDPNPGHTKLPGIFIPNDNDQN